MNSAARWVARQSEAYQIRIFCYGVFLELLIVTFWLVCLLAPLSEPQLELAKTLSLPLLPVFVVAPTFFFRRAKKDPVVPNEEETK